MSDKCRHRRRRLPGARESATFCWQETSSLSSSKISSGLESLVSVHSDKQFGSPQFGGNGKFSGKEWESRSPTPSPSCYSDACTESFLGKCGKPPKEIVRCVSGIGRTESSPCRHYLSPPAEGNFCLHISMFPRAKSVFGAAREGN